jgi:hypothetical protein
MNQSTSSFLLTEGAVITLPPKFTVQWSRNRHLNPDTPKVLSVYRDNITGMCYFIRPEHYNKDDFSRIGIFVPKDVDEIPGDVVIQIIWIDKTCAKALYVPELM